MPQANRLARTTCPYCGVGCGVTATLENGQLIAVEGDREHPANYGRLCVKGTALHETLGEQGRLLKPRVDGQEVSWEQALTTTAERLQAQRPWPAVGGGVSVWATLNRRLLRCQQAV